MAKQTITYDPQVLDLVLYAGDGASFRLTVTDPLGAPVNLTGAMKAQVRIERNTAGAPKATFVVDMSQAATGVVTVTMAGTVTAGLAPATKFTGVWDLEWTPTGQQPVTLCQGKVECNPDVSR